MITQLAPFRDFEPRFQLGGNTSEADDTASTWMDAHDEWTAIAEDFEDFDTSWYKGVAGQAFAGLVNTSYPARLRYAAAAHATVSNALSDHANDFDSTTNTLKALADDAAAAHSSTNQWAECAESAWTKWDNAMRQGNTSAAADHQKEYETALNFNADYSEDFNAALELADSTISAFNTRVEGYATTVTEASRTATDTSNFHLPENYDGEAGPALQVDAHQLKSSESFMDTQAKAILDTDDYRPEPSGCVHGTGQQLKRAVEDFIADWDDEASLLAQKIVYTGDLCRYWAKEYIHGDTTTAESLSMLLLTLNYTWSDSAISIINGIDDHVQDLNDLFTRQASAELSPENIPDKLRGIVGLTALEIGGTAVTSTVGLVANVGKGTDPDIAVKATAAEAGFSLVGGGAATKGIKAGIQYLGVKNAGSEIAGDTLPPFAQWLLAPGEKVADLHEDLRYGDGLEGSM
ncbi:hypothetical protein [Corynebacterium cystitidis]|uniref:hypothetical protein n=1 Tax=Corynebacterium cystitidis TaxID=35757 RepID=UPI00211DEE08|nr:hypothetical protein [Corynebacterium cystitidis]